MDSNRTPLTVAVVAGPDRRVTRAFVADLAEELLPGDSVVTIRATADPTAPESWRVRSRDGAFVRLGPHAAIPLRPTVVITEDLVTGSAGWVAALAAGVGIADVAAVAARTNRSSGDDLLLATPYRPFESERRATFLREISGSAAVFTVVGHLGGPSLATTRVAFESVGGCLHLTEHGFDPALLATALTANGDHLVVAEHAYLHHAGYPTLPRRRWSAAAPLVTACLIVKDEEQNLERCLASTVGIADEIVVYDTGSRDGTVSLAASLGARVIEGYWDDDFSRARNAALDECRGEWILWLDADEAFACEAPDAIRAALTTTPAAIEAYLVLIDNLRGTEASNALTHPACRLFRRASGAWQGRIHEQVFARAGSNDLAMTLFEGGRITHWGYLQSAIATHNKSERNLRTAFGDLGGNDQLEFASQLLSLGRSYLFAGNSSAGIALCLAAARRATVPSNKRLALRNAVEGLLGDDQPARALDVIEELRAISATPYIADIHAAAALVALDRPAEAVALLEALVPGIDEDGFDHHADFWAPTLAEAYLALDRFDDAVELTLGVLRTAGGLDSHIGTVVDAIEHSGRDFREIFDAISPERRRAFLPPLLQLVPSSADRVLDAWHLADPGDRAILAAAAQTAPRLTIDRRLVWSARLRTAGLPLACPLIASTVDRESPIDERILAAATAVATFGDPRGLLAFGAATLELDDDDVDDIVIAVAAIDPRLAEHLTLLRADAHLLPRPTSTPSTDGGSPRAVLLVARHTSSIRAGALAVTCARHGDAVTLLHPQPAGPSEELLAPHGVTVHGWFEPLDDGSGEVPVDAWHRGASSLIAHLASTTSFDAVIFDRDAAPIAPSVRSITPLATFVLDTDGDAAAPVGDEFAMRLSAVPVLDATSTSYSRASATTVLPTRSALPPQARTGLVVIGTRRGAAAPFTGALADALAQRTATTPIAVIGDDPARTIAKALPGAVAVGPVADPSAWLALARVALVLDGPGCDGYLLAAAAAGTPALVLSSDRTRDEEIVAALDALVANDDLFRAFAPSERPEPEVHERDPLAGVTSARRRAMAIADREPPEVRFVGGFSSLDSLAQVNRALALGLAHRGEYAIEVSSSEAPPRPAPADITFVGTAPLRAASLEIRHQWPPNFAPAEGPLILIQPWEYGGLPAEWIGPIRDVVDELWVPSHFVAEAAVESGVAPEKVVVVPNGVDTERFTPDGPRFSFATPASTRFLFVGGCIDRKGIDVLLETYLATFTASDDVCLLVKPYGSNGVYRDSTLEPAIRRAATGHGPAIEVLDDELTPDDLAALYRSCDVLVHPYRGEGFGLPVAEALASGTPVIVTEGGACDDFCDRGDAWMVPSVRTPINPGSWTPSAAGAWWLEPDRQRLAEAMRDACHDVAARARKGAAGRSRILEEFTWDHAVRAASERIAAVLAAVTADEHVLELSR